MHDTFGLLISGAIVLTGAVGTISPRILCRLEHGSDIPPGPPTNERLRRMRIQSIVMLLIGCLVVYAVFTAKGPADGPLF